MEAAWAQHTQPSASVTHNFDAKVRQGDCSCFLWEDTPRALASLKQNIACMKF